MRSQEEGKKRKWRVNNTGRYKLASQNIRVQTGNGEVEEGPNPSWRVSDAGECEQEHDRSYNVRGAMRVRRVMRVRCAVCRGNVRIGGWAR
jgi:hypothetical protein